MREKLPEISTFRKHISDCHRDKCNPTNSSQQVSTPELQEATEDDTNDSVVLVHHTEELEHEVRDALFSIQESSALLLMGLKEECKLTQVA